MSSQTDDNTPEVPEYRSAIDPEVLDAYRTAHYSFKFACQTVEFRIGQTCGPLAALIAQHRSPGSFCITAWNPLGQELTRKQNDAAQEILRATLHNEAPIFLPASGYDPNGSWAEPGFLVFGLSRAQAAALGHRFRQNALVWSDPDGVPELLLLR